MGRIVISEETRAKLGTKHDVGEPEVHQCFANITGKLLIDNRDEHRSDPPTLWFIAPTNRGRLLKVCYVSKGGYFYLRTCYPPNEAELAIYRKHGNPNDF
ncbi:ADP-ribosyl-(dinitrogen reductase) hydrolase [Xanthomonas maliensis]|nr:ADP-ribosyl-(dinitrogen reductase) hydrolase [Xanthomonas maliensis]